MIKPGELIVIYLAIGAPFGVSHFLNVEGKHRRLLTLLNTLGATLLWPWTALLLFVDRITRETLIDESTVKSQDVAEEILRAQREFNESLNRTEESLDAAYHSPAVHLTESLAYRFRELRQKTEQHRQLTFALHSAETKLPDELSPEARATELCRVAGRTGDDLHIAALCLHRRNTKKLRALSEISAQEIVHALAELREMLQPAQAAVKPIAVYQLNLSLQHLFSSAIELFSRLDDETTVRRLSRLLDAQCARVLQLTARPAQESLYHSDEPLREPHHSASTPVTTLARS